MKRDMMIIDFNPFPVLETERLILRRHEATDADEMYKYRSDRELMKYIPHRLATNKAQVEQMLETIAKLIADAEGINWAITLKGDDTLIGTIGYVHFIKNHFRAEIGYILHTPFHGKKIADEALHAVIAYGFNRLHLHTIEAIVNHENIASKKLLERNGFTNDAFFRDYLYLGDRFIDANVYSLLKP